MLNRIVIQGRLTKDPIARAMPSGKTTVAFCLACDRDYKDEETGQYVTDFVDCVAFGPTADFLSRYFTKGKMVLAEGRVQQRRFTRNDGEKRQVLEVYAEKVHFCDSKKDGGAPKSDESKPRFSEREMKTMDEIQDIDPDEFPF